MPSGACLCGAVKLELPADATKVADVYCHCNKCSTWGMGVAATMSEYKYGSDSHSPISVTAGKEHVKEWTERGVVVRAFCGQCGTHLYAAIPPLSVVATGPGLWQGGLGYKPALHTYYEHCKVPINDGLPKFKDMPEAFGGTGEMIKE